MSKIQILSPQVANMIAAGEVVERPASVVKELMENAIDAGATKIEIRIKNAGRDAIFVRDNGSGMSKEDAPLAFIRHATSKIATKKDLFEIATLGFRGEALPSIASVSQVTMITSTGEDVAYKLVMSNNKMSVFVPTTAPKGTSILVEQLFYNTPARLKHLKSESTELSNIVEVVNKLALCYPHIVFDFYHDDHRLFQTSGRGDLLEVLATIYGNDFAKDLIEVSFANTDFRVHGYIGKNYVSRPSRKYITCMLNRRPIRLPFIYSILSEVYHPYIPSDRFPVAFLAIEADYQLVDVNVHPSKSEVRLSKDDTLTQLLKTGLKESLGVKASVPTVSLESFIQPTSSQPALNLDVYPLPSLSQETPKMVIQEVETTPLKREENPASKLPTMQAIGQIHGTYLIAQSEGGFYLIDQHAAVERINYEKLERLYAQKITTASLLIPYVIELNYNDIMLIRDKLWCFEPLGIQVEIFGNNALRFLALPTWIEKAGAIDYLNSIIEEILKGNTNIFKLRSHSIATLACHDSLKANQFLTLEAMQAIVDSLRQCQNPHNCPHGRPTMIYYSIYELEKLFKRTGF